MNSPAADGGESGTRRDRHQGGECEWENLGIDGESGGGEERGEWRGVCEE